MVSVSESLVFPLPVKSRGIRLRYRVKVGDLHEVGTIHGPLGSALVDGCFQSLRRILARLEDQHSSIGPSHLLDEKGIGSGEPIVMVEPFVWSNGRAESRPELAQRLIQLVVVGGRSCRHVLFNVDFLCGFLLTHLFVKLFGLEFLLPEGDILCERRLLLYSFDFLVEFILLVS